jgi:hypothetical protein
MADFINKIPKRINPASEEDIRRMAEIMQDSRRVVLIGPMRYRDSMLSLLNLLWYIGIPSRYIITSAVHKFADELKNMSSGDLTVYISPYDSLTEINYKVRSFPQFSQVLSDRGGKRLYLCMGDESSAGSEQLIRISPPRNPYESTAAIDLLAARLFLAVTEIRNLDVNREICIS